MTILINPAAGAGSALKKWKSVEKQVLSMFSTRPDVILLDEEQNTDERILHLISRGEREFIAAGGDGTVNMVLQPLARLANTGDYPDLKLGAIGLGSSNDFHKPFRSDRCMRGIPVRIDAQNSSLRDIGTILYIDEAGFPRQRYWMLNASIGVAADANAFFNTGTGIVEILKRKAVQAAIVYAAVRTILLYRNRTMQLSAPDLELRSDVSNLGIVKNPHFSGSMAYDTPFRPANGFLDFFLAEGLSAPRLFMLLAALTRKQFMGFPGTRSWKGNELAVVPEKACIVEVDGETMIATKAVFALHKALLEVCS